jgi:hypothetical protein
MSDANGFKAVDAGPQGPSSPSARLRSSRNDAGTALDAEVFESKLATSVERFHSEIHRARFGS